MLPQVRRAVHVPAGQAATGKRKAVYDATLEGLRDKEEKIRRDLADGIRAVDENVTVNDVFELWRKDKLGHQGAHA